MNDTAQEDEIKTYLRVCERLGNVAQRKGFPIKFKSPLGKALSKISHIPFITFHPRQWTTNEIEFSISDEAMGTLENPNSEAILKKSVPSPFGKGEKTVMDPAYRNGREISAKEIKIKDKHMLNNIRPEISDSLSFNGNFAFKLYKLAIYEVGGHFEWHRDSTHSDNHHGTLLVALNTQWKGGDLLLRCNGVETRIDLHPTVEVRGGNMSSDGSDEEDENTADSQEKDDEQLETTLQAVVFYTDTEHKVEPVTEGVRIVLQYDIEVEANDKNESEDKSEGEEEDGCEDYDEDDGRPFLERIGSNHRHQLQAFGDQSAIQKVSAIIEKLHEFGVGEVAFPLQYLYRRASIRPEFLKGSDAPLFDTLTKSFDVSLHPVVLDETFGDSEFCHSRAYLYDYVEKDPKKPKGAKKQKKPQTVFYMTDHSGLEQLSYQEYTEHTGNEAQPGETRYLGAGMFVRPKANA